MSFFSKKKKEQPAPTPTPSAPVPVSVAGGTGSPTLPALSGGPGSGSGHGHDASNLYRGFAPGGIPPGAQNPAGYGPTPGVGAGAYGVNAPPGAGIGQGQGQGQQAGSGFQSRPAGPPGVIANGPSAAAGGPPAGGPSSGSSSGHAGGSGSGNYSGIIYPWTHRRLALLPASPLPPLDPAAGPLPSAIQAAVTAGASGAPVSLAPFPRYGHSVNPVASPVSGDLYIFGGLVRDQVRNDLYILSCTPPQQGGVAQGGLQVMQASLVETRGEIPGPRVGHASVGVGNVLIVWGGDTKIGPEDVQDDGLYLLNLSTRDWTFVKVTGAVPEGRYGHAAAMVGSKFFVFGGQKDDGGFLNDLWSFDLQKLKAGTPRWSFINHGPNTPVPPKRTGHTCITHEDCIYIFGGTDGMYHYNDTWQFNTTTQVWTELQCIGYIPVPREGHAATLVDDVMYVLGGRGVDGKDLEDLAAFRITNKRWYKFQNMGPAPSGRSGHAMATWQNKVFVLGGESYTTKKADDPTIVHVLDTGKIKYPPDPNPQRATIAGVPDERATSPTGGRKAPNGSMIPGPSTQPQSFASAMAAAPGGPQAIQPAVNGAPKPANGAPPNALGAQANGSKIAKRATSTAPAAIIQPTHGGAVPPQRPRREDDPPRPGQGQPAQQTAQAPNRPDPSRAISPTAGMGPTGIPMRTAGQPGATQQDPSRAKSPPTTGPPSNPPSNQPSAEALRQRALQSGSPTSSPTAGSINQFANQGAAAIAATQAQQRAPPGADRTSPTNKGPNAAAFEDAVDPQQPQTNGPPADAFYYGTRGPASNAGVSAGAQAAAAGGALALVNGRAAPAGQTAASAGPSSAPQASVSADQLRELKTKEAELEAARKREKWMKAALVVAQQKGFALPGLRELDSSSSAGLGGQEDEDAFEALSTGLRNGAVPQEQGRVVEALLALKQELARAKNNIGEQSQVATERITEANRGRAAAVQEASFFKAKLAALESHSQSEASRIDRERMQDLERRLAEALAERTDLDHQLTQVEAELDHEREMRETADDRAALALQRAEASENAYSRALSDYAELQRKAHSDESLLREHSERVASLASVAQQSKAEHEDASSRLDIAEGSIAGYLATIEQAQSALSASNLQASKMEEMWKRANDELADQRTRVSQLQTELERHAVESTAARQRADEVERLLTATRSEHEATRSLAHGHMTDLLSIAKRSRDARDDPTSSANAARLAAVEEELDAMRNLHKDSRTRADSAAAELTEARSRQTQLEKQVLTLRAEASSLRTRLATTSDETGRLKSQLMSRDVEAREKTRLLEAAEVRVALLKNVMGENGLAVADEDGIQRAAGDPNGLLSRRVAELEARLEDRQREADAAREGADQRLEESERLRQSADATVNQLSQEVEQLRVGGGGDRSAGGKTEEELRSLQERHRQLEATHMKAVVYVKGTEKMLRRMKEELTKYKERNEQLESELSTKGEGSSANASMADEMDVLRTQLGELRAISERSAATNDELQQRLTSLQGDYDREMRAHQSTASKKNEDLSGEVRRLEDALGKSQQHLEESLQLNGQLNEELRSALKNPSSPRSNDAETRRLEQEVEAAQNKSEWLKRENTTLQDKVRDLEQKISILLDYMETQGYHNASSSIDHSNSEHDPTKFETLAAELDRWDPTTGQRRSSGAGQSDHGSEYSVDWRIHPTQQGAANGLVSQRS